MTTTILCSNEFCIREAKFRVTWEGHETPLYLCEHHFAMHQSLARAVGSSLTVEQIETVAKQPEGGAV